MEIDKNQNTKKDKIIKQILAREYGSFITTFLNADFSNAENAYYSFFVFYGLEGLDYIGTIMEKYPIEYAAKFVAFSHYIDLTKLFYNQINFKILTINNSEKENIKTLEDVEKLAYDISNNKSGHGVIYSYRVLHI